MNFATGNNYSLLAGDDIYGPNNIYAYILDYCHNKNVSFSPNIIVINNLILRDFNILKIKIKYAISKNLTLKKLVKKNIFSAPGAHINFDLVNKDDFLEHLFKSKGEIYEDYPSWIYFFLLKKYFVNIYSREVVFYRPKFNLIDSRFLVKRPFLGFKFKFRNFCLKQLIRFKVTDWFGFQYLLEDEILQY
jgi:hypothetical protein